MLLAVPMKGLRARPAFAVDVQYATDLPIHPVGHQVLDRLPAVFSIPQNHQANGMIDVGKTHGPGEKPLFAIADVDLFAVLGGDPVGPLGRLHLSALEADLTVAFKIPHVAVLYGPGYG